MSLRSLIQRHAGQLLTQQIQVEVASKTHDPLTGKVTHGAATTHDVVASEIGDYRIRYRDRGSAPQTEGYIWLPVPAAGLDFTPDRGQVVIADGIRWRVIECKPSRVRGELIGYRLELVRGGA